jgi:4-amino-4-deoxy-L-arabinose transferase-like glycosyltransferase
MHSYIGIAKKHYILALILILAFFIRFWGINVDQGFMSALSDEMKIISASLKMLNDLSFIPDFRYGGVYFPLMYYVYMPGIFIYTLFLFLSGTVTSLIGLKEFTVLNLGDWLIVGRMVSVILGVGSVYLIYLISQRLFKNKLASYLAALFMATNPLHVSLSQIGKHWGPQMFFILLAFYTYLYYWQDSNKSPTRKAIILTSLTSLLAISENIYGLFVYFILLLVWFLYYNNSNLKKFLLFLKNRYSIMVHSMLALGTLFMAFIGRNAFIKLWEGIRIFILGDENKPQIRMSTFDDMPLWKRVWEFFNYLLQNETVIIILLIPALIYLFRKKRREFYLLFPLFLLFWLSAAPPLITIMHARYFSAITPFMILPVAFFLSIGLKNIKTHYQVLIIIILILPTFLISMVGSHLRHTNSHRYALYNWVKNEMPADKSIWIGGGTYLLQDIVPTQTTINNIKKYAPIYYSSRLFYLDNNLTKLIADKGKNLMEPSYYCSFPENIVKNKKIDYLAIPNNLVAENKLIDICGLKTIELSDDKIFYKTEVPNIYLDLGINKIIKENSYPGTYFRAIKGASFNIYKL